MQPPANFFTRSKRRYLRKLPELEYQPGHELRRVTDNGTINWDGSRVFLTNVLRNQVVGAEQKDECSWDLYFGPVLLGSPHRSRNDLGFRRATMTFSSEYQEGCRFDVSGRLSFAKNSLTPQQRGNAASLARCRVGLAQDPDLFAVENRRRVAQPSLLNRRC